MKQWVLAGFVFAVAMIGAAQATAFIWSEPPVWAPWLFMLGTVASLITAMAIGASRYGGMGPLGWVFGLVFLILAGGFGAALALPPADPVDPTLWFGLPPRAAIILYGVGFLPFLIVPLAYALTFERNTLRPEDWERVLEAAARYRGEHDRKPEVLR